MGLFDGLQAGLAKLQAGEFDEAEMKARVERQIRMKPCIMYGMQSCPRSKAAKQILGRMGAVHTYIDFDEDDEGMAIKATLHELGYSDFPAVFVGGTLMGDVKSLHAEGKLEPALTAAGSLVPTQRI